MTTTQRVLKCRHLKADAWGSTRGTYVERGNERFCLECAADLYERGEGRYQAAWLLVHGRELDKKSRA
jgi:hypothetical protein